MVQSWIDQGQRPSIGWQVLAYAVLTASEVMVSITGLEFAYTQAPKKMKSVIMALFLMSVSLGNLFTAAVNQYILIPDRLENVKTLTQGWRQDSMSNLSVDEASHLNRKVEAATAGMTYNRLQDGGFELVLKHWEESTSDGDMRVGYGPDLDRRSLLTTEVSSINRAIASVGQFWDKNDRLPFPSEGELSIQAFKDPWGNHLHYRLINRSNFEISSDGPDQEFMTKYDVRAIVEVQSHSIVQQNEIAEQINDTHMLAVLHPKHSWIDVRRAELDAAKAREQGDSNLTWEAFLADETVATDRGVEKQNHKFDVSWEVGGATKLNGASYFEFFTWLMLGTAISFVVVGYLYKPKTYVQDEMATT
jgi:POT family proton-dependent oligopeptide transporter